MNTLTLPDHISFEEIAAKWCEGDGTPFQDYHFVSSTKKNLKTGEKYIIFSRNLDEESINVAWFFIKEKKFVIDRDYDGCFDFILDYIEEGYKNEITIPAHISFEKIAMFWCYGRRNAVQHKHDRCLFVEFYNDSFKVAAEFYSNSRKLKIHQGFCPQDSFWSVSNFLDHVKGAING